MASTSNPYASHPQLSQMEQDVLWEYSLLGDKIKRIANLARLTAEHPNEVILADLRDLEKKLGLVLTLFKGAVYSVLVEHKAANEAEAARQADAEANQEEWTEDDVSY